jgi:hypothetical protein
VVGRRRIQDARDADVALAWRIAAWHPMRTPKLPALKSQLSNAHETKQTARDHRNALMTMSAQYGIPLQTAKKAVARGE